MSQKYNSLYDALNLNPNCTDLEITHRRRHVLARLHPEHKINKTKNDIFKEKLTKGRIWVEFAFGILSNPASRATYNKKLKENTLPFHTGPSMDYSLFTKKLDDPLEKCPLQSPVTCTEKAEIPKYIGGYDIPAHVTTYAKLARMSFGNLL